MPDFEKEEVKQQQAPVLEVRQDQPVVQQRENLGQQEEVRQQEQLRQQALQEGLRQHQVQQEGLRQEQERQRQERERELAAEQNRQRLEDKWGLVEKNMPPVLEDEKLKKEKDWVKNRLDILVERKDQEERRRREAEQGAYDRRHSTNHHSTRFFNRIDDARRRLGNSREIYKLSHVPDETVLGKEYQASFKDRITGEKREQKKHNKKSRLYRKNENAALLSASVQEFQTASYDRMNRAMTKQALRCDKEDYNDLAMFMQEGEDQKNIELVNLYLGKSVKWGPGGLEGQDVQQALDLMAAQLFSIDIRELHFENDTEMVKNAAQLEKIAGQVAAFDRMAQKAHFMESLDEDHQARLNERLESLRSIAAYYSVRKEIISNEYYKNHYNDELSMDVIGATREDQAKLAEKLVQSLVLGRSMMRINGIDVGRMKYNGEFVHFTKEDTRGVIRMINSEYSDRAKQKELAKDAHKEKDALAERELLRLKEAITKLDRESPLEEQKKIQADMAAVQDRAILPVQRPENRIGGYAKFKNSLKLGWRWLFGNTLGLIGGLVSAIINVPETLVAEGSRRKTAQDKRRHDMVPGREGEYFREEIVRKDDKGEDLDVYSDVRRGPLVWEKLTAGDPEEPPEVMFMVDQAKRGSNVSMTGEEMGHAMICLSYSRYNKATKRKERYQVQFGFYPGAGIVGNTEIAMLDGAIIGGRLQEDNAHSYDVARRYQVKPGDINKILRKAERYADKGYGYYKRNCTTFVVDMAKEIGLPVGDEFKQEQMVFEGKDSFKIESGRGMAPTGMFYTGANAISSRMNKMDVSYQNFGQKMYTKEDLDRYYKTAGTAELLPKGYTPGHAGETLRYTGSGELSAHFDEHLEISSQNLKSSLDEVTTELWDKIAKTIPEGQADEFDAQMNYALLAVEDGGLQRCLNQKDGYTPDDMREVHKMVRDGMRTVNKYYTERLHSNPDLNDLVMKYLSLCETVLSMADDLYAKSLKKAVAGDAGVLRYDYTQTEYDISFTDAEGVQTKTKMEPGLYEGYLMAHKTPEQAVKEYARFNELVKINEDDLSKQEKRELSSLRLTYSLAKDFASANRYILEKDHFDEKDIRYAFSQLPKMEKNVKEGERVGGPIIQSKKPSLAYQGVIYESMLGGLKDLHLERIRELDGQVRALDQYITDGFIHHPEMARQIIKAYIDGKNQGIEGLFEDYLMDLQNATYLPAYDGVGSMNAGYVSGLTMQLMQNSRLKTWFANEVNTIRNGGGA